MSDSANLELAALSILQGNLGSAAANEGLSLITSYNNAAINISGGTNLSSAGDLDITSMVDGALTGSASENPLGFNIAVVAGGANPSVMITGSDLYLHGRRDQCDGDDGEWRDAVHDQQRDHAEQQLQHQVDGAVAVTVFDSEATLSVSQSSTINAEGRGQLSTRTARSAPPRRATPATPPPPARGSRSPRSTETRRHRSTARPSTAAGSLSAPIRPARSQQLPTRRVQGSSSSGNDSNPSENTLYEQQRLGQRRRGKLQ